MHTNPQQVPPGKGIAPPAAARDYELQKRAEAKTLQAEVNQKQFFKNQTDVSCDDDCHFCQGPETD